MIIQSILCNNNKGNMYFGKSNFKLSMFLGMYVIHSLFSLVGYWNAFTFTLANAQL